MTQHDLTRTVKNIEHHKTTISHAVGALLDQPLRRTAHVFHFSEPVRHRFHTVFFFTPIDIAFLHDQRVIETTTLTPFSTHRPRSPADQVIELPPGTITANQINKGDTVHIP